MSLFVDTSIWYAATDRDDADNARAKAVLGSGETLVTTDHVLVETWLLVHHRVHRTAAERFWEGLRRGAVTIEPAGPCSRSRSSRCRGIPQPQQT